MKWIWRSLAIGLPLAALCFAEDWLQWGQNPQHTGLVSILGQHPSRILANILYDPFVPQEQAEVGGDLLAHYQTPLVLDQDVFMEFKTGHYVSCTGGPFSYAPYPCGPDNWNNQVWNEKRLHWEGGKLVEKWSFASDWKPEPDASGELGAWEPVFHAAVSGESVYVPGAGGTVWMLNKGDGKVKAHFNPFGNTVDPTIFVAGPLTADSQGNIYYNALKLNITNSQTTNDPWSFNPPFWDGQNVADIPGAWLVKISGNGGNATTQKVSYKNLIPTAPAATAPCKTTFAYDEFEVVQGVSFPYPPSPSATVTSTVPCLSQRPGLNIAPAVAPDGTIYSVTVAHNPFASRYAYVVALTPSLTLKWAASMRGLLHDGCGVLIPTSVCNNIGGGVDPSTNEAPAGRVIDQSTSSPVVAPDGSVLFGAYTAYNYARGHLFHFSATGQFLNAYDFGWDTTPAIYKHGNTWSVVEKDNNYGGSAYCGFTDCSPEIPVGPFYITQLSPNMHVEWKYKNTNTLSCQRNPDGSVNCTDTGEHPNGFEWCINAPAIDGNGNVYANSEDGNTYVIQQGGTLLGKLFTNLAIGAAYTPLSLGPDGKIYTQNDGRLFVIGN